MRFPNYKIHMGRPDGSIKVHVSQRQRYKGRDPYAFAALAQLLTDEYDRAIINWHDTKTGDIVKSTGWFSV